MNESESADVKPVARNWILATTAFAAVVLCCAIGWRFACGEALPAPRELSVYAWEDYLDTDILAEFTARTGVKVRVDTYATVDESLAVFDSNERRYDLALVDEAALPALAAAKLVRPFDLRRLPQAAQLDPRFADPSGMGIAYLWGCTGFAFDKRYVSPEDARSIEVLWDPRNKGRVALLDDLVEVIDVLRKRIGHSSEVMDAAALVAARQAAVGLATNEIVLGDTFSNLQSLVDGRVWIAQAYSGDVLYRAGDFASIGFSLPREGFPTWVDYFVMPSRSRLLPESHALVDFLTRPEISARSAARFHYDSPIRGAALSSDRARVNGAFSLPPVSLMMQGDRFRATGPITAEYQKIFNELRRRLP